MRQEFVNIDQLNEKGDSLEEAVCQTIGWMPVAIFGVCDGYMCFEDLSDAEIWEHQL